MLVSLHGDDTDEGDEDDELVIGKETLRQIENFFVPPNHGSQRRNPEGYK